MRVLIVEDDKIIGDGLRQGLMLEGYAVDWVEDKESAETALKTTEYSVLILDVGLPDGSGIDLLQLIRHKSMDLPVLILTAYDDVSYRVQGLDAGADDYMVKPFDLIELLARVRALRRRATGRSSPALRAGDVELNPATRTVTVAGSSIEIGPKEFAILHLLMEKKQQIVSKARLEESLYGWEMEVASNTVEVYIHGLRRKLGKNFIRTIRNVGYQIDAQAS